MPKASLPPTPQPLPPDRFQFSLASIMIATVAAAIVMGAARAFKLEDLLLNAAAEQRPAPRVVFYLLGTLLTALLVYLCLRLPYLWTFISRRYAHAGKISRHKQELLKWAEETKAEKRKEREHAEGK